MGPNAATAILMAKGTRARRHVERALMAVGGRCGFGWHRTRYRDTPGAFYHAWIPAEAHAELEGYLMRTAPADMPRGDTWELNDYHQPMHYHFTMSMQSWKDSLPAQNQETGRDGGRDATIIACHRKHSIP